MGFLSKHRIFMKYAIVVFLFLGSTAFPQTDTSSPSGPTVPKLSNVNPEILQLVIQDQWDRGNDMFGNRQVKSPNSVDWKQVSERDEQRHAQVRRMLAEGRIQTGQEYYFAALIFQHSAKAEDLMLGHVLAVTSVGKGYGPGKWLAAATLDRYLTTTKQPQVFGTQFFRSPKDQTWTMDPYDRSVLSDSERAIWCVVPISEQDRILKKANNGNSPASTQVADCR